MNVLEGGRSRRNVCGVLGGCVLAIVAAWLCIFVVGYLVWTAF